MNLRMSAALAALVTSLIAGCGEPVSQQPADGEDTPPTIESLTENSDRADGMFALFTDRESGEVRMLLDPEDLGTEFIYGSVVQDGPVEAGFFRGEYRPWLGEGIVRIQRQFGQVEFIRETTAYTVDPESAVADSVIANMSPAVLAVTDILAEDKETGAVLIDAGPLFLGESFTQLKAVPHPEADPEQVFDLGSLSEEKTRFDGVRAYPENVDFFVRYVFENPGQTKTDMEAFADHRVTSVVVQHSLIRLPDNGYAPRRDDPRIGYFVQRRTDLMDTTSTPWRDVIRRWHLEKENPDAPTSDPVEPIVFWIENTTPPEYREAVRTGALAWNQAFESAGFTNAIEVRVQPDDAEWDAGDIRYHVIRWQATPQPPFGGYGPSIANPRTGEIIGADVVLDHSWVSFTARYDQLFGGDGAGAGFRGSHSSCAAGLVIQHGNALASMVLAGQPGGDEKEAEMLQQSLQELVLHEVGHALGLAHNFRASQVFSPDEHYDAEKTRSQGLRGSVMDYSAANLVPPGREQGMYFQIMPGPYDHWAIEYGYSEALADPVAEERRLSAILARSTEAQLLFGNDADDMRAPGAGIDPTIMIFDGSSDAIRYADDRMGVLDEARTGLLEKYRQPGNSYAELANAYRLMAIEINVQARAVSRYVGGVLIDRAFQDQPGGTEPFRPVSREQQARAMAFLARRVLAPEAFQDSPELLRHLQQQRRDFDFYGTTEDPKIHELALSIQKGVLDHLLHPVVLRRMTDTTLYGNEYPVTDMMTDLTAAVFDADMSGKVNGFRQNLQSEYVGRLVAMMAPDNAGGYDQPSRAMALYILQDLRRRLAAKTAGDPGTRAHTAALLHTIDQALETS